MGAAGSDAGWSVKGCANANNFPSGWIECHHMRLPRGPGRLDVGLQECPPVGPIRKTAVTESGGGRWQAFVVVMAAGLVFPSASVLYAQDLVLKVKSVEVRGNKRVEEPPIRGRLTLKVGDAYTAEAIRALISRIYQLRIVAVVQRGT